METIPLPNAQLDAPSSIHAILKIAGAVITALVTWFFVATVVNLALRALWPHYHEAEIAFNFTFAMKFDRLVFGAIWTLCAGSVVDWIDRGRLIAATLTGVVLICLFNPGLNMIWNICPLWSYIILLLSLLPLTLLGAA